MISFAGTLVVHVIPKVDHGRIADDIDLMILLAEFLNRRVPAEIAEPGEKFLASLNLPDKVGKNHDNLRMPHRRKILDLAVEPCLVDLTHGCGRILAFGFVTHHPLLLISARASYQRPAD